MKFAFVSVPVVPVYRKAGHKTEMVNQLLFGEAVQVLKEKDKQWAKVESLHDGYKGWIVRSQLEEASEEAVRQAATHITTRHITTATLDEQTINLPAGCFLPSFENGSGTLGSRKYSISTEVMQRGSFSADPQSLLSRAKEWLNAPYLWGGRTILGVDCSGFVQVNFRLSGKDLPRDAWQQAGTGTTIKRLRDAQPGDLAFFDDREEVVHVGILMSSNQIIHSSGRVRIDEIDKKGIINSDTGRRTHILGVIKRVIGN